MGWPGPLTQRQMLVWNTWLDLQWDRPSRTDHYLMAICFRLLQANVKNAKSVKFPRDVLLKFREPGPAKALTREEAAAQSRSRWLTALGGERTITVVKG